METLMFSSRLLFCLLLISLALLSHRVGSEPTQDKQALLAFLTQTPHESRIQWNSTDSACNWVGVECDPTKSYVYSLRLPGVGLIGPIPPNTIGRLTHLRVISLRSNRLSGQIPSDFSKLTLLRSLYLQGNVFSGEFPPSLTQLTRLTRLDISSNNFSGPILSGINNLTHLKTLFLQNNHFSSNLPSISVVNLQHFNASYNELNGSIPKSLSKFNESAFVGNLELCGPPLPPCKRPFFPTTPPSNPPQNPPSKNARKRLSKAAIIAISIGSALIFLLILVLLLLCLRKRVRPTPRPAKTVKESAPRGGFPESAEFIFSSSSKDEITSGSGGVAERNKLVFAEGGVYSFDLEDLLRASAEVLGKGSAGTSYKAVLEEGTTVVVKRLKDVAVGKKDFENVMGALGKVKHENVVPLRAYYYSKDEKLLVYDYMANGSLSSLLHGSRGSGRTPLVWEQRLKIAICAGRGLAHLHASGKVVHGNIKSSNILLRPDQTAVVSDFGLNPLLGALTPNSRVAGYRAPEVIETRKVTQKSDVYSFGVLLLELLTGKAPNQASLGEEGIDLPRWVQSVVREEWTAEVFDVELMRYQNIEDEMVQLLQIAMACVAPSPDQRPVMAEVLRMMEEMNRGGNDDGLRMSSDEPSKESDGQTPPQESRGSPKNVTP